MFGALAAVGLMGVASLTACPDPKGRLDDWFGRSEPLRKIPSAGECVGISDISGSYLLGVAVSIDKSKPLRFKLDVTVNVDAGTIDATMQPIAAPPNNGATEPGTLVGEKFTASSPIDPAAGTFSLDFGGVDVPLEANPIIAVPAAADIALVGCTATPESSCGLVDGKLTKPIDQSIEGSTWAIVPLPDGTNPISIELVTACPDPT